MTPLDTTDTIAAIASPPSGGWRGLVRVTGPAAFEIALGRFRPSADADQPTAIGLSGGRGDAGGGSAAAARPSR